MANVNHMPWDNGAIADALDEVLGFHVPNKTKKTRCALRVAASRADHKQPITCPDCKADIEAEAAFLAEVRQ